MSYPNLFHRGRSALLSCIVGLAAALVVVPVSGRAALAGSLPNVLFILADDMGYSDAGSYGGEIDTPNLDRLADEGVRFSRFRATPMCVTTRVAFLSGMSLPASGSHGRYERVKPLPQSLREAG